MNNILKGLALGAVLLPSREGMCQDWHANFPPGNVILGPEYMGADLGSLVPLRIKTRPDLNIEIFTATPSVSVSSPITPTPPLAGTAA